jgi:hypothetical protein
MGLNEDETEYFNELEDDYDHADDYIDDSGDNPIDDQAYSSTQHLKVIKPKSRKKKVHTSKLCQSMSKPLRASDIQSGKNVSKLLPSSQRQQLVQPSLNQLTTNSIPTTLCSSYVPFSVSTIYVQDNPWSSNLLSLLHLSVHQIVSPTLLLLLLLQLPPTNSRYPHIITPPLISISCSNRHHSQQY